MIDQASALASDVHICTYMLGCAYLLASSIASDILALRKHVNLNHVDVLSTSFWISLLLVFEKPGMRCSASARPT